MIIYTYDENELDDEEDNSYIWGEFWDNIGLKLDDLSYPLILEAQNSNWRGQTGYAEVKDFQDLINKICSFDSSFIEFYKDNDKYYFKLATHDVPCGFCVYIKQGEDNEK